MRAPFISSNLAPAPGTIESVSVSQIPTSEVSVIVPVFSESAQIAKNLIIIRNQLALATERGKILAVDDGSSDNTWERLTILQKTCPEMTALRLSRNFGREAAISAGLDETWSVSTAEQELLARKRPGKRVHVGSNIVGCPGSAPPFASREDFLFIGSFQHPPNIDAVIFSGREILPLVRRELPAAKFFIIGDKAPPDVVALSGENVIVTGLVPDARPYFDNVKLSVAPLRYGAGVKGKINQSMGLGVPVVATSVAAKGMDLTDREDVLLADDPADFARGLIELYNSATLWNNISEAGLRRTEALCSRATAGRQLRRIFFQARPLPVTSASPIARESHSLASV